MPLSDYRTLGRSGLVVSPLALGTMTFGTARWGSGEADSRAVFDAYIDAGGNFVDTADVYASGRSETLLGQFINDRSLRPQIVIATKAGFSIGSGPNRGGNGSSHLNASINASLRRLAQITSICISYTPGTVSPQPMNSSKRWRPWSGPGRHNTVVCQMLRPGTSRRTAA